jgi:hypothetical protein
MSFLLLLASLLSQSTFGDTAAIRSQIQTILLQRHPADTDGWWRALGPDAPQVIIAMYGETTDTLHQIHLLQGLSAFQDDPAAVAFLDQQAKSGTGVIKNAALGALGACEGEKALDTLSDALKSDDPQTRFAAAKAIHRVGGARAGQILDAYFKSEKVSWISTRVMADVPQPRGLRALPPPERAPRADEFAGEWKGYWIEPGPKGALVSLPAKAVLRAQGKSAEGELLVSEGARQFKLLPAPVESGQWRGSLQQTLPARDLPAPQAATAEVTRSGVPQGSREAGALRVLVLRVPALGVTVVLSRL